MCNQCIKKEKIDRIIHETPKNNSENKIYKNKNIFINEEKRRGFYNIKKELEDKMQFKNNKYRERIPM